MKRTSHVNNVAESSTTAPAPMHEQSLAPSSPKFPANFWKFWAGETISSLGSAFTTFGLPLLVYRLTGSAVNLAFSMTVNFLPYLLFGLLIGAYMDRWNRKRAMIVADLGNALIIGSLPLLAVLGLLAQREGIWFIYTVGFLSSTLTITFNAGQFAAVPSLVGKDELLTANGRLQASYSAATVLGPILAGLLLAGGAPLPLLFLVDALSFLVSAGALARISTSFNLAEKRGEKRIGRDVVEGLRYVWHHPVLRNISIMAILLNLGVATIDAQLVLFAKHQFRASDTQVGFLYAAGSLGVVALSLQANAMRKRWAFSKVALGAVIAGGLFTATLALTPWYALGLLLWAVVCGVKFLFGITTSSLRQLIVPNDMLSRVTSFAQVVAWSVIPLGSLAGGLAIAWTGNIALIYGAIGVVNTLIGVGFTCTALGRAEEYLSA